MITRTALGVDGHIYVLDWYWACSSEGWWVELEEVDGGPPDMLTDEKREAAQIACADAYPLAQYQDESAQDAAYYER